MSLWDSVRRGASRAAAEAEKQATIAKLAMEVNTTKGKINEQLEEMGKTALGLYRDGTIDHATLEPIVVEITKLEAHVKELEDQIAAAKASAPGNS
jgi:ABC-type phosphate transport system auxiliary subunit